MNREQDQQAIIEKAAEMAAFLEAQGRTEDAAMVRGIPAAAEQLDDSAFAVGPDAVFGRCLRMAQQAASEARMAARRRK